MQVVVIALLSTIAGGGGGGGGCPALFNTWTKICSLLSFWLLLRIAGGWGAPCHAPAHLQNIDEDERARVLESF